ncbi:MAG: GH116 family glycosyl-hydrolase [Planctomycetota bacterium]
MFAAILVFGCGAPCLLGQDSPIRPDARWYEGDRLEAVAMPVGGIGTGTVWVSGDGRLAVWQIFNNYDEKPLPDSSFAVRVAGEREEIRVLQRGDGWGKRGFRDVRCLGEYPFLRIFYRDEALPVEISLEAFNPLVPTATKDSSIPCAVFVASVRNRSQAPVDAAVLSSVLNPLGYVGGGEVAGPRWGGFGSNRNRYEPVPGGGAIRFEVDDDSWPRLGRPVSLGVFGRSDRAILHARGSRAVRLEGEGAPKVEAAWFEGLSGGEGENVWRALGSIAQDGGVALVSGARPSLFERIAGLSRGEPSVVDHVVFEDFEKGTYEGWTVEGEAFGNAPHTGTSPGQQPVSGFRGNRLVNTFVPDDGPRGRLVSRPFRIERRAIGFLVGGGGHEGRTCVNLLVDGKVVRTKTGRNLELLEPASWDVSDLRGKEARIEILDRESGGWGHVSVDHIVFSDEDPRLILAPVEGLEEIAKLAGVRIRDVRTVPCGGAVSSPFPGVKDAWSPEEAIAFSVETDAPYETLVQADGLPLVVSGPFGKGRLVLALARGLPASWGMSLLAQALGTTYEHGEGIDPESALYGDLSLAALGDEVTARARWQDARELWEDFAKDGRLSGPPDSGASPPGETYSAALSVSMRLEPGAAKSARFILSWHFPNVERFGHRGNRYAGWFANARESNAYVRENLSRLEADTRLFHDSVYASNLPYTVLDAMTSQLAVLRGPTCWWALEHKDTKKDYFAGYEGCYACCPLNCTHVWNYAQGHARLFPEIGRNLRRYDFLHYLREDGETQHRQHSPHGAFVDGQAAVIEAAYREHLMSPDDSFLREVYPGVAKAMDWLIRKIDPDEDGVNGGEQWNTYDVATNGAHTFIGSQYLSALAAAERMALRAGDEASARRWRKIREAGSRNQTEKLWSGQYFIQIPDRTPARDYNTGCHSDQLLGQWWAHMLGTGYLYPPDRVRAALRSIYRHNFRQNFRGFRQAPRRYVLDDEAGLLICSWPQGGRPNPFILYADEIWTGIEYATAGLMIYEGLLDEGFAIVNAARDRYDGRIRHGLNSGPGGNPFNELECGKFYARAMSSWGLLLACQGFVYDGPAGILGFQPRAKPEDHASFFSAAEGWGFFRQRLEGKVQREEIECRWGQIRVAELVFAAPVGWKEPRVRLGEKDLLAEVAPGEGSEVRIRIPEARLRAGDRLLVEIPIE